MQLHDIFPKVPIEEYSFYSFLAVILGGLALIYLLYRVFKHRQKKMHPLHILEHYNPNDAKKTAHQLSYYGKKLAKSEVQKQHLFTLEKKLTTYKYLKTSHPLSNELQKEIELFLNSIRHKDV
jgi:hypothetical protein